MSTGEDEGEGGKDKGRLEVFDGTQPLSYRTWKRRAQLMLASLPSTIKKEQHGPKLMGYIGGEAEALLEQLEIEGICAENGDKAIWAILDDKYNPQPVDLLQSSLKTFFHELSVKPMETYRQFFARFAAAQRKLEEQKVVLPKVALGFLFMKKLRLEASQESLILTTSGGKLEIEEVIRATNTIFPEGKGSSVKTSSKDVFQVDPEVTEIEEEDDLQAVMDMVAEEVQGREDWEEEDVLETFETYKDIRRKLQESKNGRGYFPKPSLGKGGGKSNASSSWQISGTLRGKIDQLKARTRCHRCKRLGHWKKECPLKSSASSTSSATTPSKEVLLVENSDQVKQMWESFITEKVEDSDRGWQSNLPNHVLNPGFADTHSTGNRQISDETVVVPHESTRRLERSFDVFHAQAEMSALSDTLEDHALKRCGIPDTACRRTLVGETVLDGIEDHLSRRGLKVHRVEDNHDFRFGNNGMLSSTQTALLPASVGGKRIVIKAAVLPKEGKTTPLLMSKELLKQLGCVLDMVDSSARFDRLDCSVPLETKRGHYAIPLFDHGVVDVFESCCADAADCLANDTKKKNKNKTCTIYKMHELENCGSSDPHDPENLKEPPIQEHGAQDVQERLRKQLPGQEGIHDSGRGESDEGWSGTGRNDGHHSQCGLLSGSQGGCGGQSDPILHTHGQGQVQGRAKDVPEHLHGGQVLRGMGEDTHQRELPSDHEEVPSVCGPHGQSQDRPHQPGSRTSESHAAEGDTEKPSRQEQDGEHRDDGLGGDDRRPWHECGQGQVGDQGMGRDGHQDLGSQLHETSTHDREDGSSSFGHEHDGERSGRIGPERVLSRKARKRLQSNVAFLQANDRLPQVSDQEHSECVDVCTVDLRGDGVDVSELFSVPRIGPVASKKGLKVGGSYDLWNGWDFLNASDRKKMKKVS